MTVLTSISQTPFFVSLAFGKKRKVKERRVLEATLFRNKQLDLDSFLSLAGSTDSVPAG